MDTNEYLELFLEESEEHLQSLSDEMMRFEENPNDLEIVKVMFRAAHTLKGMAGSMGFGRMQKLTHNIENIMDDIRNEKIIPDEEIIDFIFKGIERLEVLLNEIRDEGEEKSSIDDLLKTNSEQKNRNKTQSFNIELTELEINAMLQAIEEGQNVFKVFFELREDCILKYVRTIMFFDHINEFGEIFKMNKTEEQIESDEDYDGKLELIVITKEEKERIENIEKKLSEVKSITAMHYEVGELEKKNREEKEIGMKGTAISPGKNETQAIKGEKSKKNNKNKSIRVKSEKLDNLMTNLEELIVEKGILQAINERIKDPELSESIERLNRSTTEMQNGLLSTRMVPIDTIFNRFPRMVRSISKDLGKTVEFIIEGQDTELDRSIVEDLGDPLIHLLRNSLDHGIELPDVRRKRGKSETGTINLRAYHKGNEVIIEIEDDGNGIDVEKIKKKIIERGIKTEEEVNAMPNEQIIQYIFSSGLSTAEKVSNLSGRGVGLDVVKTYIEQLGGTTKVESEEGIGSKFTITIPLTLSIIQTLLVKDGNQTYLVPLVNVVESILLRDDNIRQLAGKKVLYYRNEILDLHNYNNEILKKELCMEEKNFALIVQSTTNKYALLVDEVLGEYEVVLKPLTGYIRNIKGVSGATVLGDGRIAFVIDVNFFEKQRG